jgi:hypothetical protein
MSKEKLIPFTCFLYMFFLFFFSFQMKPLIQQHVKDTEYVFMILNNIAESHPLQDKKEMNKVR